jgi:hypothetical protein
VGPSGEPILLLEQNRAQWDQLLIRRGLAALERADLVQGAVRPAPDAVRHPLDRTVWVVEEAGLYETANLFVRKPLFERLGGFEEWSWAGTGRPFGEDVWFGWRARRANARTTFCDEALVQHAVFRASLGEYVHERRRLSYFPALAKQIPELRATLFYGRVFLSRRTAAFDASVVGATAALVVGSPIPLVLVLPYFLMVGRRCIPWRRHAPKVLAANLLADAIGFASLLEGSVRSRSVVL